MPIVFVASKLRSGVGTPRKRLQSYALRESTERGRLNIPKGVNKHSIQAREISIACVGREACSCNDQDSRVDEDCNDEECDTELGYGV